MLAAGKCNNRTCPDPALDRPMEPAQPFTPGRFFVEAGSHVVAWLALAFLAHLLLPHIPI